MGKNTASHFRIEFFHSADEARSSPDAEHLLVCTSSLNSSGWQCGKPRVVTPFSSYIASARRDQQDRGKDQYSQIHEGISDKSRRWCQWSDVANSDSSKGGGTPGVIRTARRMQGMIELRRFRQRMVILVTKCYHMLSHLPVEYSGFKSQKATDKIGFIVPQPSPQKTFLKNFVWIIVYEQLKLDETIVPPFYEMVPNVRRAKRGKHRWRLYEWTDRCLWPPFSPILPAVVTQEQMIFRYIIHSIYSASKCLEEHKKR